MDKIEKLLKRLSAQELLSVEKAIEALYLNKFEGLDIKKLKGHHDIFRVRVSKLRIIFRKTLDSSDINILEISRRSEKTYKNY